MRNRNLTLTVAAVMIVSAVSAFAQTGYLPPNPISPPVVSPPVMSPAPSLALPEVTPPTMEGPAAAKAPEKKSAGTSPAAGNKSASGKTSSATATDGAGSTAGGAANSTSLSATALSLMSALGGGNSEGGSMDALSGLLGGKSAGSGSAGTSASDSATMQKVLELLEKQQAQLNATQSAAQKASAEKPRIVSGGEIVRFTVNGFNIDSTITALVSSSLAKDGAFLLTGNRLVAVTGGRASETFYLLCKKNKAGIYQLFADVSQDTLNESSYLYQLARKSPLNGLLAGDLLVFRTSDANFRLDLVIRIIVPSVAPISVR